MDFERAKNPEKEKPRASIVYGQPGHSNEYVINLEDHGAGDFISDKIVSKIKDNVGDEWQVTNRGSRIEIYGDKNEEVEVAASKALEDQYEVVIE